MKHYHIEFMPTAKVGLLEIGEFIALDNPKRAISFVKELTLSLRKTLSTFPLSGKIAQDLELDQEIRVWSHGNYNSYYRVLEDKEIIEVLFVFHGSRDVQSLIMGL
ncbi:MAG: type II toxin-antitoxin system RelE/ParE family toxin [Methylococcaceae bacterium]